MRSGWWSGSASGSRARRWCARWISSTWPSRAPGRRRSSVASLRPGRRRSRWFARKLREHASPGDPGALRLLAAHLDSLDIPIRPRLPAWTPAARAGLPRRSSSPWPGSPDLATALPGAGPRRPEAGSRSSPGSPPRRSSDRARTDPRRGPRGPGRTAPGTAAASAVAARRADARACSRAGRHSPRTPGTGSTARRTPISARSSPRWPRSSRRTRIRPACAASSWRTGCSAATRRPSAAPSLIVTLGAPDEEGAELRARRRAAISRPSPSQIPPEAGAGMAPRGTRTRPWTRDRCRCSPPCPIRRCRSCCRRHRWRRCRCCCCCSCLLVVRRRYCRRWCCWSFRRRYRRCWCCWSFRLRCRRCSCCWSRRRRRAAARAGRRAAAATARAAAAARAGGGAAARCCWSCCCCCRRRLQGRTRPPCTRRPCTRCCRASKRWSKCRWPGCTCSAGGTDPPRGRSRGFFAGADPRHAEVGLRAEVVVVARGAVGQRRVRAARGRAAGAGAVALVQRRARDRG